MIFWKIDESGNFTSYAPPASNRDVKQVVTNFSHSLFLPGATGAVSSTQDGDLVLWDYGLITGEGSNSNGDRRAVKVIRVHQVKGLDGVCV